MNFFKRSFLSIWGHKAKTIILFVVFAVIGSMLLGSLAIENTSKQVVNQAKESIGCKISVSPKFLTNGNASIPVYPRIDRQFESQLRKINHVTLVNRFQYRELYPKGFKVPADENAGKQADDRQGLIISLTDTAKYSAFSSGSYKLVAGRHLDKSDTGKNNVIINQKVADSNNIKLGDKITVTLKSGYVGSGTNEVDCSYTVVGIYKGPVFTKWKSSSRYYNGYMYVSESPDFFLDSASVDLPARAREDIESMKEVVKNYKPKPEGDTSSEASSSAYLFEGCKLMLEQYKIVPNYSPLTMDDLKEPANLEISVDSPENLDYVLNGLEKINSQNRYEFTSYADQYNRIITPIKTARKLSSLFTYVIFGAGLLIMALIVILSLRSRKHEFGILLAMGEKKVKIIIQVLIETLVPVVVSLAVAFAASGFIGGLAAKKIVNDNYKPFDNVITMATLGEIKSRDPGFDFFNIKGVEQINKIDVGVTPADVGIFAGCSLLIVILACGIPMIKIVKLSPMNVLTHKD